MQRSAEDRLFGAVKALEWCAQTVHSGHHHSDEENRQTWRECTRGFCASVRHEIAVARGKEW